MTDTKGLSFWSFILRERRRLVRVIFISMLYILAQVYAHMEVSGTGGALAAELISNAFALLTVLSYIGNYRRFLLTHPRINELT